MIFRKRNGQIPVERVSDLPKAPLESIESKPEQKKEVQVDKPKSTIIKSDSIAEFDKPLACNFIQIFI